MSIPNKQQFLVFVENLYLAKIQGQPISWELHGWAVGILDNPAVQGEYLLSAKSPSGHELLDLPATAMTLLSSFEQMYGELARLEFNDMTVVKYENLHNRMKQNLARGSLLAYHTASQGVHLTTVQIPAEEQDGSPGYYCEYVCEDFCGKGSVRLVMPEMPKEGPVVMDVSVGPTSRRNPDFNFPPTKRTMELSGLVPVQEISAGGESVVAGVRRGVAPNLGSLLDQVEVMEKDQGRLEGLRAWMYEQFRRAIHQEWDVIAETYANSLFFLTTGVEPRHSGDMFGSFFEFMVSSVIERDAEVMPEFPGADCGC